MIIQLIYWKSVCRSLRRGKTPAVAQDEHSLEEKQSFQRLLQRHHKHRFIRYR